MYESQRDQMAGQAFKYVLQSQQNFQMIAIMTKSMRIISLQLTDSLILRMTRIQYRDDNDNNNITL